MHTIMPDKPPSAEAVRSLHEICEAARYATCGECWQEPGRACTLDPDGYHVARFGRAMRRGLISGPDLIAVLQALDAFTNSTVVYDEDQADEDEPYCVTCGVPLGIFYGHGDGWHHWRGNGTAESPVELFDAGHAPEVAWRPAGAQ